MLKSWFHALKRMLLALAGGLGGLVVGGLLCILLFHLKVVYSVEIRSFGLTVLFALVASMIVGMFAPRFFMMFFLSPLCWFMDSDVSGGGHPSGDFDVAWPDFLFNVAYGVGLLLFVSGAFLSLPWVVGFGLFGILVFSFGAYRLSNGNKGKHSEPAQASGQTAPK